MSHPYTLYDSCIPINVKAFANILKFLFVFRSYFVNFNSVGINEVFTFPNFVLIFGNIRVAIETDARIGKIEFTHNFLFLASAKIRK